MESKPGYLKLTSKLFVCIDATICDHLKWSNDAVHLSDSRSSSSSILVQVQAVGGDDSGLIIAKAAVSMTNHATSTSVMIPMSADPGHAGR